MKRPEWLEAMLEPAFGTVNQWISDQLGTLGAEEEACYALLDGAGNDAPVRILVACDLGLADLRWERPADLDGHRLSSVLLPWREVSPPQIEGETRLSGALIHQPPSWTLTLSRPEVRITDPEDPEALLAFWRACSEGCGG